MNKTETTKTNLDIVKKNVSQKWINLSELLGRDENVKKEEIRVYRYNKNNYSKCIWIKKFDDEDEENKLKEIKKNFPYINFHRCSDNGLTRNTGNIGTTAPP